MAAAARSSVLVVGTILLVRLPLMQGYPPPQVRPAWPIDGCPVLSCGMTGDRRCDAAPTSRAHRFVDISLTSCCSLMHQTLHPPVCNAAPQGYPPQPGYPPQAGSFGRAVPWLLICGSCWIFTRCWPPQLSTCSRAAAEGALFAAMQGYPPAYGAPPAPYGTPPPAPYGAPPYGAPAPYGASPPQPHPGTPASPVAAGALHGYGPC